MSRSDYKVSHLRQTYINLNGPNTISYITILREKLKGTWIKLDIKLQRYLLKTEKSKSQFNLKKHLIKKGGTHQNHA